MDDLIVHPSLRRLAQSEGPVILEGLHLTDLRRALKALDLRGKQVTRMLTRREEDEERLAVLKAAVRQQFEEAQRYQEAYVQVLTERDSARRERDAAMLARDNARAELAATEEQVEALRAERDRLREAVFEPVGVAG